MAIDFSEVAFGSPDYKKLLELREEVLRKPIGMRLREKDVASDALEYHLAAFDNVKPIACALLRPLAADTIQLRQVAVLEVYRGQKIGSKLIGYAERFAFEKDFLTIETRARKTAQGFYETLGYAAFPGEFEDEHTLKMRKSL